ncbi:MAG: serine O-acetyltransferase, partial [Devosia sp.]
MSTSARKSAEIKSIDPVWDAVRAGARQIVSSEPSLSNMAISAILNHDTFEQALAHRLAARLDHDDVSADLIRQAFAETLSDAP